MIIFSIFQRPHNIPHKIIIIYNDFQNHLHLNNSYTHVYISKTFILAYCIGKCILLYIAQIPGTM